MRFPRWCLPTTPEEARPDYSRLTDDELRQAVQLVEKAASHHTAPVVDSVSPRDAEGAKNAFPLSLPATGRSSSNTTSCCPI